MYELVVRHGEQQVHVFVPILLAKRRRQPRAYKLLLRARSVAAVRVAVCNAARNHRNPVGPRPARVGPSVLLLQLLLLLGNHMTNKEQEHQQTECGWRAHSSDPPLFKPAKL